jgi:hypothetical protein
MKFRCQCRCSCLNGALIAFTDKRTHISLMQGDAPERDQQ